MTTPLLRFGLPLCCLFASKSLSTTMGFDTYLRRKLLGIIVCLAAACSQLNAQNARIEELTIADGLSQGMIYSILQSKDGFLWFATKDGLNRYDGYHFEVFTNDPFNPFSIAGNDITNLFEDSKGNIWLTVDGKGVDMLEKTSGKFFHLPTLKDDIKTPGIVSFVETTDGTVWMGTRTGLVRFRWKNALVAPIKNPDLHASMTIERVSQWRKSYEFFGSLSVNQDGTLLVSRENGIFRFSPTDLTFTPVFKEDGVASCLYETAPGRVWTVFNDKMFVIENGIPRKIEFGGLLPIVKTGLSADGMGNLVLVITTYSVSETRIYSVSEEQVLRTGTIGQPTLIFALDKHSPCSAIDRSGNLWVGTNGYGLRKINLRRPPFRHYLAGTSIDALYVGKEIYTWQPSVDDLYRLDETANTLRPVANGLATGLHLAAFLAAKDGTAYYFTIDPYNRRFSIKTRAETRYFEFESPNFFAGIIQDQQGNIWVGTYNSLLLYYQPATGNLVYFDLSEQIGKGVGINALHADAHQNLWVGTANSGMIKWNIGKMGIQKTGPQTVSHRSMAGESFQIFQTDPRNPHSLRHNFVSSFCADPLDPDRYLWVSTKGGGLNLFDKNRGQFVHFVSQNSGLPNDVVYGILPENTPSVSKARGGQHNLWMSTNRGLSRLTVSTEVGKDEAAHRVYGFKNFREFDGLQSDEFNTRAFARCPDGRLLFGGVNGLTAFYPSQIQARKMNAQILITGLKINNVSVDQFQKNSPLTRPIHQTDQLRLDHTQNIVNLEFALMDFVTPTENRYRYRLQGIDPGWVEAGTGHVANYAHLGPGNYVFEVQGSIGGNAWTASALLHITVMPPWWATWWAYLLYAVVLGAGLYLFYKFQLRQKLAQQEVLRMRALDEFKSRFFTNITHEFRTPLTVILGSAKQLESDVTADLKSKVGLIHRNGEGLLRLINQILDLSKLESNILKINYLQADILPYLRYIAESLHSVANTQNVLLRVESNEAHIIMDYDAERLLQIVYNLLSNAITFTPSGGRVVLRADLPSSAKKPLLRITVTDTGVGIPQADLPNVFDRFYQATNQAMNKAGGTGIGLSLTKELVKALDGNITVDSSIGKGTTFTVLLPITNLAAKTEGVPDTGFVMADIGNNHKSQTPNLTLKADQPTLLLIEDNPDVVEYLIACLGDTYQLDFAYNGRAGIEKAVETVPDLIISDVMMPEKDGFEVCDFLKNDERTSHIPLVLLTAKADIENRITGLTHGADAYLTKPFYQKELAVTLANLLASQRKRQVKYRNALSVTGNQLLTTDKSDTQPLDLEDVFLKKLRGCIEKNMNDPTLDVGIIAKAMTLSESQLYRKVKALTDKSTVLYIRSVRLQKAHTLLQNSTLNVSEIAYEVGFNDPNYFSRAFQQEFGKLPSESRN